MGAKIIQWGFSDLFSMVLNIEDKLYFFEILQTIINFQSGDICSFYKEYLLQIKKFKALKH